MWYLSFLCLKLSILRFAVDNFFIIPAFVDDAPAFNPNGFRALFDNIFHVGNWDFITGSRSLPRNPSGCIVFYICVLDNLMIADELPARITKT